MNNLAIIPARSGSKGLKDKNIRELNGKPMLAYSIDAAKESGLFSHIMVSTDSHRYADIAKVYGAEVPFLRSDEMSSDVAGSWDVVTEVLEKYMQAGIRFDTVCLLQPTSPLRKAEDIVNGYAELEEKKADAITGVCEMEHSPLWATALSDDLSLTEIRKNIAAVPRQMLQTYYRINGALYIRRVIYKDNGIAIQDQKEYAYVMKRSRSVDIDTIEDFDLAEYMLNRGRIERK